MKMLQVLLLVGPLVMCGAASASAQSAPGFTPRPQTALAAPISSEALQAAKELVALISESMVSDMIATVTAQVWPNLETALRARNPNIDSATLAGLRSEFQRIEADQMIEVMNRAPVIYARHFTFQELRDMAAFYRTPIGAKMLQVTPALTAELTAMLVQDAPGLQQRVRQSFGNILRVHGYEQ